MLHRPYTQKEGRQIQTVSAFPLLLPGRLAAVLFSVIGSIHTALQDFKIFTFSGSKQKSEFL